MILIQHAVVPCVVLFYSFRFIIYNISHFSNLFLGFQIFPQIFSGIGLFHLCNFFRGTGCHNRSAAISAFRSHINDLVRSFDHIQIVFDDDNGIAALRQTPQDLNKLVDILKVQSGCRFIQYIYRLTGASF